MLRAAHLTDLMQTLKKEFLEIKRHKTKPDERFKCELLHNDAGHLVLRYRSDKPGRIADIAIPPGSTTIAHYWPGRTYVAWRMFDSSHCLLGTLFHVSTNISVNEGNVAYDDLLLDIWITPGGSLRILDEDEVRQASSAGLLSDAELTIIDNAHWHITTHYRSILDELAAFESTHSPVRPDTHSA
jgi:hypothetical protein